MLKKVVSIFAVAVLASAAAVAQTENHSPVPTGDAAATPMASPIVTPATPTQVPGTVVEPGPVASGGASCMDCPVSASAGTMMGGYSEMSAMPMDGMVVQGVPVQGAPVMGDAMPIASGGDCGCSGSAPIHSAGFDAMGYAPVYGGDMGCGCGSDMGISWGDDCCGGGWSNAGWSNGGWMSSDCCGSTRARRCCFSRRGGFGGRRGCGGSCGW